MLQKAAPGPARTRASPRQARGRLFEAASRGLRTKALGGNAQNFTIGTLERAAFQWSRHCEERSDEPIQRTWGALRFPGLLRFARNDAAGSTEMQLALAEPVERDRVVDQDAIAGRFVRD